MATEDKQTDLSSQSTTPDASRPKPSTRSSILKSLRQNPTVHNWLHPNERANLCKDCYNHLYESFPLTWLSDHGSLEDVEKNSDNGICTMCKLIVQTLKEDERKYANLNKTHKVRIMHLSRFLAKSTAIAGGSFNELRVTVDNVEVCQLLTTRSSDAKNSSLFEEPSQIENTGVADFTTEDQRNGSANIEADFDLELIDSMTIQPVSDVDESGKRSHGSTAESVAESVPETIPEPMPDARFEVALTAIPDPSLESTPEPVKTSRRKQLRNTLREMRRSTTTNKSSPSVVEEASWGKDYEASKSLNRVESQTIDSISDVSEMPQERKMSSIKQWRRALRENRWRTELLNFTDYRSNWFESLKERRQLNFETVKFWIANCRERHKGETLNNTKRAPLDIILVDVRDGCLINGDTGKRYLAFSYQWGKDPGSDPFMLKKDNFQIFQEKGSLFRDSTKLPVAFVDAMSLVKNIGERYLWIDKVCIKQDDQEHFVANIDRMDEIFGQSLATIVKMTGDSAWDPLPGVQSFSRPPPCNVVHTQDRVIVCRHPSLGTLANDSPYETR
ncbi:MAG: hypothetical protein Q9227_002433 [Pyrenula ochraceoflavens]